MARALSATGFGVSAGGASDRGVSESARPVGQVGGPRGLLADAVSGLPGGGPAARAHHLRHAPPHSPGAHAPQVLPKTFPGRRRGRGVFRYVC